MSRTVDIPPPRRGRRELIEDTGVRLGLHIKSAEQAMMAAKTEALRSFGLTVLILGGLIIGEEDLLDGQAENARDGEGQGQGGVVTPGLQGVDRLAGDTQLLGEAGLSPAALSA